MLSGHIIAENSMLLANANHRLEMRKEEVSSGLPRLTRCELWKCLPEKFQGCSRNPLFAFSNIWFPSIGEEDASYQPCFLVQCRDGDSVPPDTSSEWGGWVTSSRIREEEGSVVWEVALAVPDCRHFHTCWYHLPLHGRSGHTRAHSCPCTDFHLAIHPRSHF